MSLNKGNEGTLDIQSTNFRGGEAKYTVEKEGITYVIRDRAGMRQPGGSTYPEIAIQGALDGLTDGRTTIEKVQLVGDFTGLGAPIVIGGYTHFKWDGTIALANSVNDHMIENENPSTYDINVIIEGGYLQGNNSNNTAGNGIYWEHSSDPTEDVKEVNIRYVKCMYTQDEALYLDFNGSPSTRVNILGWTSKLANSEGIYATDVDNLFISWCGNPEGNNGSIHLNDCTSTFLNNVYLPAGLRIVGCVGGGYSNMWVDHSSQDAVRLEGSTHQAFGNCQFRIFGSAGDVTHYGVDMTSDGATHCTDNIFSNIQVGRVHQAGTSKWRYGIHETDSNQDYNTYNMINGRDCTSGAVRMLGSNSVNGAEILGSVITS